MAEPVNQNLLDLAALPAAVGNGIVPLAPSENETELAALPAAPTQNQSELASLPPAIRVGQEVFRATVGGVRDALQQAHDTAIEPFTEMFGELETETAERVRAQGIEPPAPLFVQPKGLPTVPEPGTLPGQVGREISKFLTGFALTRGGQGSVATTGVGRFAQTEAQAVAAGQGVFDPSEERLSNLIQTQPALANPVTELLSASADDSVAEARFKMALEDLGLGVAVGGVLEGVRAVRANRKAPSAPGLPKTPETPANVIQAEESIIDLSTDIGAAKRAGQTPLPQPTPASQVEPNLNVNRINSTDDVKVALQEVEATRDNFAPARRGVVSNEETRRLADTMGLTEAQLLERRGGQAFNAHEALAARDLLVQSGESMVKLAQLAKGGSDEAVLAFRKAFTRHVAIQEQVAGLTAEAGRALQSFNIPSTGLSRAKAIEGMIESQGGRGGSEKLADQIAALDTPEAISSFTRKAFEPTTLGRIQEYWINALLSGPQTHAVNMLSNAAVAVYTIPEQILAAGLGAVRKGSDKVTFGEVTGRAFGLVEGMKDGLVLAGKSLRTGEPSDVLSKIEAPRGRQIGGRLGTVINIPTRLLQTEDEFFKAIGYRMELNALAMRQGLEEGLEGPALARRIADIKTKVGERGKATATGDVGGEVEEAIHLSAIDTARYQTFTTPTGPIARSLQSMVRAAPALRFIVPFIRTPSNIIKFAAERTPFGLAMKEVRERIAAGGVERDTALARMSMGTAIGAVSASLAAEGHVTGAGPSDPDARATKRLTGWQPYSFKFGDEYTSYSRVEPLGMLLGVSADFQKIASEFGEDDPDVEKLGAMIVSSIAQNLTSKTWLSGITSAVEAFQDPQRFGQTFINRFGSSFVPTGLAQAGRVSDPVLRDARTLADSMLKRLPGFREDLPPRRNLFGDVINLEGGLGPDIVSPLYTSTDKHEPLASEMARLEMDMSMPNRKINGHDLDARLYSEYAEVAGKTGAAAARQMMALPGWSQIPDDDRSELLKSAFFETRKAARGLMKMRHSELIPKGED